MKQDAKEVSRHISKMFATGAVLYPQMTEEQNAKAKFPSDKPILTLAFRKGGGDHDTIAKAINDLHASVGGGSDIVRDGDAEEGLKKYNSGQWVMRVRFGPRAKLVDTQKKSIGFDQVEMHDKVRLAVSLFDYSDRNKKGISIYVNWCMLLEKGGIADIPDFEGGSGFIASDAAPAVSSTVELDDDQGVPEGDPRLPESMMALLSKQRQKSVAR